MSNYQKNKMYQKHLIDSVETLRYKVSKKFLFDKLIEDIKDVLNIVFGNILWTDSICILVENVKVGDIIQSWDEIKQEKVLRKCIDVYTVNTREIVELTISGERLVYCKKDMLYVLDKGWINIDKIQCHDFVRNSSDRYVRIEKINKEIYESGIKIPRIKLEDSDTIWISKEGILLKES